jgi:hypothetical protein
MSARAGNVLPFESILVDEVRDGLTLAAKPQISQDVYAPLLAKYTELESRAAAAAASGRITASKAASSSS